MAGTPIHRPEERWVRFFGVPIHEGGAAREWFNQLQATWKQYLQLIHHSATRFEGTGTRTYRQLRSELLNFGLQLLPAKTVFLNYKVYIFSPYCV